jgi:hypothetical protein
VSAQTTVTVHANQPWVNTGLSVATGQRVWVDTRSDGQWSGNPKLFAYSDANGSPVYPGQYRVYANAPVLSLIGFVGGHPPTHRQVSVSVGTPSGGSGGLRRPGLFEVGDTLQSFSPPTTGTLWLRNNDNTNAISDVGEQTARIYVTR